MQIVKQSATLLSMTPASIFLIERAGRVCYKSEGKGECSACGSLDQVIHNFPTGRICPSCVERAETFIRKLIERGHESVLEHASATFLFVTDRGVTHELVRHRLASYSQECLSGDTEVAKGLTLRMLWDYRGKPNFIYPRLKSVDDKGRIIMNGVRHVFHKGVAMVYEVVTKLGYVLKATSRHEFKRPDGSFSVLGKLEIGDSVMVNGRPCLLHLSDQEVTEAYLHRGLSPAEISDTYGAPYRSVVNKLKRLGIFEKHLNDKNLEKYNRNHTETSTAKMQQTIQSQYDQGRRVWNKDVREGEHPSVDRQAASLRKNHHDNGAEEENSNWEGGVCRSVAYRRVASRDNCSLCSSKKNIHVHHLDRNPRNNREDNLLVVCSACHSKLHRGWHVGKVAHPDTIVSIREVGTEEVFDVEMDAPYHNYVANGFIVHNSTRYCAYNDGIQVIQPLHIRAGTPEFLCWMKVCESIDLEYRYMLDQQVPAQWARSVLPTCLKTEIVCTANLREWRHMIKLRTSEAAHPQIRDLFQQAVARLQATLARVIFS